MVKKKCKRCGAVMNLSKTTHADLCYDCEEVVREEKEAYDTLQEQNSNYWHDVAGSIKND